MEVAIPLIALGSLYVVSNHNKKKESFAGKNKLPNTDIPDKNYPDLYSVVNKETDITNKLSVVNKYDGDGAYTDKYFNLNQNPAIYQPDNTGKSPIGYVGVSPDVPSTEKQYYSLTGDKVDANYFNHTNMQPYFKGSVRTNLKDLGNDYNNDRSLDSLQGMHTFDRRKTEQSPLFSPEEGVQWAYGTPCQTDLLQSRVSNVSNKMNNINPFKEQHVLPGLGGLDAKPHGYNTGLMSRDLYLEKTVDDLRVANKQKVSNMLYGYEGPAISPAVERSHIGVVDKKTPDRVFENTPERYFTTTGAYLKPALHGIQPDEKTVNRATTGTSYVGVAGAGASSTYTEGEYMPSKHQDLGAVPLSSASATGRNGVYDADYGIKAQHAYTNNRSTTGDDSGYFGAVRGTITSVVAPLLDVLRPTKKECTVGNMRPYENAKGPVSQTYYFNPADRPAPTIRDTYKQKVHLNVDRGQHSDAYSITPHQVSYTNRNECKSLDYMGAGSVVDAKQCRVVDAEYNQRNNDLKSSTLHSQMVKGNMNLYNASVNMKWREKEIENSHIPVPTFRGETPNAAHYGTLQRTYREPSTVYADRSNPEILDALKSNPYTLSVVNGL
jgi:hypothetical protein